MELIYTRTEARAQSQDLLSEIRAANVLDKLQDIRMELDYWEYEIKGQYLMSEEINEHSNSLIKRLSILRKEAILADVELTVCEQISDCRATVQLLTRNALYELERQEDRDAQHLGSRREDELRDEINLHIL